MRQVDVLPFSDGDKNNKDDEDYDRDRQKKRHDFTLPGKSPTAAEQKRFLRRWSYEYLKKRVLRDVIGYGTWHDVLIYVLHQLSAKKRLTLIMILLWVWTKSAVIRNKLLQLRGGAFREIQLR